MPSRYARRLPEPTTTPWSFDQLAAECERHFAPSDCAVRRDEDAKTVWISTEDSMLEVAVQTTTVERKGLEETLGHVEERLLVGAHAR